MKCSYCEWRCELEDGNTGVCGSYIQENSVIKERYPHQWTTFHAAHIESLPFYHAYPGSRTLVIGGTGCNFDCSYCSNSYVARESPSRLYQFNLKPEQIVRKAGQTGCHNIVFAVNEPIVSLPSIAEIAREAQAAGIPVGCMTNGFQTPESIEQLSEICSFINISLKSISSSFYKKYVGVEKLEPILRNIKYLAARRHIEITTPIIQSLNDHEIDGIAAFIYSIDPLIPWHVFRLLPEYKMKDYRHPGIEEISSKLEDARKLLPYTYFSNFVGSDWVSTICPVCSTTVIERINAGGCGGKIIKYILQGDSCPHCGHRVPLFGGRVEWSAAG